MQTRVVMKFHPRIAPIKAAVFPLVNKDGMPEVAQRIYRALKQHMTSSTTSGAVGRRYRRQDEAGTPFCITVDGQTLTTAPSRPRPRQPEAMAGARERPRGRIAAANRMIETDGFWRHRRK